MQSQTGMSFQIYKACDEKHAQLLSIETNGWMDDLRFHALFNSIIFISGGCAGNNERLCAVEHRLRLKKALHHARLELLYDTVDQ